MDEIELVVVGLGLVFAVAVAGTVLRYGRSPVLKALSVVAILCSLLFGFDLLFTAIDEEKVVGNGKKEVVAITNPQKNAVISVDTFEFEADHGFPMYILDEGNKIPILDPEFVETEEKEMSVTAAKVQYSDGKIQYMSFRVKVPKGTVLE